MNRDSPPTQPTQRWKSYPQPLLKEAVSAVRRVQFAGFIFVLNTGQPKLKLHCVAKKAFAIFCNDMKQRASFFLLEAMYSIVSIKVSAYSYNPGTTTQVGNQAMYHIQEIQNMHCTSISPNPLQPQPWHECPTINSQHCKRLDTFQNSRTDEGATIQTFLQRILPNMTSKSWTL